MADLEAGKLRVAEKVDGVWQVNTWVKKVILAGFKLGVIGGTVRLPLAAASAATEALMQKVLSELWK